MPDSGNISMEDLRTIIHGLKMSTFSFIPEEEIRDKVIFMIEELPSPEKLTEYSLDLKNVKNYVGEIMRLIEVGGKRDEGFKVRHEAKKNMPPRYKVLTWRKSMNEKDLTKSLIKMSVYADDRSEPVLAEKAIELAQSINNGVAVGDKELKTFTDAFENSQLHQEAAFGDWWAGIKGGLQGGMQGAKNVGHMVADPAKANASLARAKSYVQNILSGIDGLEKSLSSAQGFVYNPGMKESIGQIIQEISQFKQQVSPQIQATFDNLNNVELQLKQTTVPTGTGQETEKGTEKAEELDAESIKQYVSSNPDKIKEVQQKLEQTPEGQTLWNSLQGVGPDAPFFGGGSPAGTATAPAAAPAAATFAPNDRVQYRTKKGVDKGGVVKQILDDGKVQVQLDGGGIVPAEPNELKKACERYRMHKEASSKKWIRIC